MEQLNINILLMVLGVAILFFILVRTLVLWYFKIEERTKLMHEQTELLRDIRDSLSLPRPGGKPITNEEKAKLYDLKHNA